MGAHGPRLAYGSGGCKKHLCAVAGAAAFGRGTTGNDVGRPILEVDGMYELVKELKDRGYKVYLLSNASVRQHEYWPRIPAAELFDGKLISSDVHLVKPQPENTASFAIRFRCCRKSVSLSMIRRRISKALTKSACRAPSSMETPAHCANPCARRCSGRLSA